MGHSTEAPRDSPPQRASQCVCVWVCKCVRVCLRVPERISVLPMGRWCDGTLYVLVWACVCFWTYGKEYFNRKWERERERENGMKKTFFRDYSPPLLAPHPFRPLSWQMEVAERWRDRRMTGGRDGGGRDEKETVGSNWVICSTAAPRPSVCPSVHLHLRGLNPDLSSI